MPLLPPKLVELIRQRIANPQRRHETFGGVAAGMVFTPDAFKHVMGGNEAADKAANLVFKQMEAWGQSMKPMHVTAFPDGTHSATTNPDSDAPAPPATDAQLATLEQEIGRPLPADLRELYKISNGGWGPGVGYTPDYGTGIVSTAALASDYADLRRRGPGYTGQAEWPAHYLPIASETGPTSYDLDTGQIVRFDDYYYDNGKSIPEAFSISHQSLADWLEDWVVS